MWKTGESRKGQLQVQGHGFKVKPFGERGERERERKNASSQIELHRCLCRDKEESCI